MSLERTIYGLIADIDELDRLYHRFCDVPLEVQDCVKQLCGAKERLLNASKLLARTSLDDVDADPDVLSGKAFKAFRSQLLELELLLDPEQIVPRSGKAAQEKRTISWDYCDHGDYLASCLFFKSHLSRLDADCLTLNSHLRSQQRSSLEPKIAEYQPPEPLSLKLVRPFTLGSRIQSAVPSPTSSHSSPRSGSTKASPHVKTQEEMIFDRFVQQYTRSRPPGKRKRASQDEEVQIIDVQASNRQLPFPFPNGADDLVQMETRMEGRSFVENSDVPDFDLDDLRGALPSISLRSGATRPILAAPGVIARGKQRASIASSTASTIHLTEYSSSSSGSTRSMPREGSIFSVASRDRMYDVGSCKLWHRQGHSTLQQIDVIRTDVQVEPQQCHGLQCMSVTVMSTTSTGHEIPDRLFIPALETNSTPFLEHVEVVNAFQRHDPTVRFMVRFAPNASAHPQYSFDKREDCWEFMQRIGDGFLCASIDVESIKSAATHGHAFESSMETVQIWEDRHTARRTIKFFRNRNEAARKRIIDVGVECLRRPSREKRTGKLVFDLRDTNDPITKELKYLKIEFSSSDAEEGFLHEIGARRSSRLSTMTAQALEI